MIIDSYDSMEIVSRFAPSNVNCGECDRHFSIMEFIKATWEGVEYTHWRCQHCSRIRKKMHETGHAEVIWLGSMKMQLGELFRELTYDEGAELYHAIAPLMRGHPNKTPIEWFLLELEEHYHDDPGSIIPDSMYAVLNLEPRQNT